VASIAEIAAREIARWSPRFSKYPAPNPLNETAVGAGLGTSSGSTSTNKHRPAILTHHTADARELAGRRYDSTVAYSLIGRNASTSIGTETSTQRQPSYRTSRAFHAGTMIGTCPTTKCSCALPAADQSLRFKGTHGLAQGWRVKTPSCLANQARWKTDPCPRFG